MSMSRSIKEGFMYGCVSVLTLAVFHSVLSQPAVCFLYVAVPLRLCFRVSVPPCVCSTMS